MQKIEKSSLRRTLLIICIILLVAIMLFFRVQGTYKTITSPLGLSFYTLGAISYVVDVKRKTIEGERNYIKLLTWLSFFPVITAGPIYRYGQFSSEYDRSGAKLKPEYARITNGIVYMIWGYFLKLVVAERAAIPVDYVFEDFDSRYINSLFLIIIAITYSLQIYADFAGYSAIVIGLSQILGFYVLENFAAPYLSCSIKEFWGRWHISLSTWLRDYVYIPLGGNRKGNIRKYCNISVTFFLSGLWHGSGLHFLAWGVSMLHCR